ncbi:tail fiber domain-containing protein [Blastomonas sp.]|uniref:tail fiber domain-containing protein n=1 Tax=Blastomonas sp. TaxID=1909299 RepID=UPI00406A2EB3
MAWYRTGTVTVTNGSGTITGSGTAFIANVFIGEAFLGPDGRAYEITNVASDTSLTISPNYQGSTAGGQGYAILPARGRIADLIAETQSLLGSFAPVRDGIGAGLFPDGSAATPAFRFINDQDTGFYRVGSNAIGFATAGALRAIITSDGSMGLGTVSLASKFHVVGGATLSGPQFTRLNFKRDGIGDWYLGGSGVDGDNTFNLVLNSAPVITVSTGGAVGIGTSSPSGRLHVAVTAGGDVARFDGGAGVSGYIYADSANLGFFNTASAGAGRDGILISNGTQVAIEVDAASIAIATSIGLLSGADNARVLGSASLRWSTVYAGTGTINTSDEREKHWRGELSPAELRAAKRIIGELGIYQWNDAVAEKGEDGARLHFGVRAQQAFAIMEDEGLDWGRYAWACYDQWEEQTEPVMEEVTVTKTRKVMRPSTLIDPATGQPAMVEVDEAYEETEMRPTGETRVTLEAGDRYGVRPDQLAFWLIAAQAAVQADLEARLATLETA